LFFFSSKIDLCKIFNMTSYFFQAVIAKNNTVLEGHTLVVEAARPREAVEDSEEVVVEEASAEGEVAVASAVDAGAVTEVLEDAGAAAEVATEDSVAAEAAAVDLGRVLVVTTGPRTRG
jgi:hypothetical protein